MGEENISNSCSSREPANANDSTAADSNSSRRETQVILNVYDLTPINHYSIWIGFGIFHSGIEVYGMEYGFGAHDFPISGVFEVEPKSCPGFIYRCSIPLGQINIPPSEFRTFIENVASEYHGDTYHLISKNCNHFTDDMAKRLTRRGIPGWVNRLARLGAFCSCLLPESLQVTSVKQLPEYHICAGLSFYTNFGPSGHKSDGNTPELHFLKEEDGSGSITTVTPQERTESEDSDQDKHLLSPPRGSGEVSFIREVQK